MSFTSIEASLRSYVEKELNTPTPLAESAILKYFAVQETEPGTTQVERTGT